MFETILLQIADGVTIAPEHVGGGIGVVITSTVGYIIKKHGSELKEMKLDINRLRSKSEKEDDIIKKEVHDVNIVIAGMEERQKSIKEDVCELKGDIKEIKDMLWRKFNG